MRPIVAAVAALLLGQAAPITSQEVDTRRLPVPDQFYATSVSYDGRYFSSSWFGEAEGKVALMEVATGAVAYQVDPGISHEAGFPDWSQVSRDGTAIAFTSYNGEGWDLRVVERDGEPRVLLRRPDGASRSDWYPWATDWSPDGRQIVVIVGVDYAHHELSIVSPEDGSRRVLHTLRGFGPGRARMSPDGAWIAYDYADVAGSLDRDVWVIPTAGGRPVRVADSEGTDVLLAWLPDGSGVLVQSDREGTDGWWTVPVREGRNAGPARQVKADVWGDPVPLGMTKDGSLYHSVSVGRRQVVVADFDASTMEVAGTPRLISGEYSLGPSTSAFTWSPEGDAIAFIAREGNPQWGTGGDRLVIWSSGTGELRELTPAVSSLARLVWTPGGDIIASGLLQDGVPALFRIDGRTASVEPFLTGSFPLDHTITRDGRTVYYRTNWPPEGVYALDLETRTTRSVYAKPEGAPLAVDVRYGFSRMRLSPDERTLLLGSYDGDAVLSLPTEGGTPEELLRLDEGESAATVRWAEDGETVLVTSRTEGSDRLDLWRYTLPVGEKEHVATCSAPLERAPCFGQVSPDARRIAFAVGQRSFETWVARGFPSAVAGGGGLFRR